ncbi:LysR substrate-binding domain-containing protein [Aliamphritea ceti]|uniref:LysR substrate-binding domain-containing protein n=1 Tax=Aliamphritea ceti TaxID=1524258 RepID=UPI0021C2552B|nr:LysR substrate-binding domain-containing protein [Aliamphritea ceti]
MMVKLDKRGLPLNALRSFEVTGRLLSMRLAAQELGVTHGAVSHQVRALEERLGIELFIREHNRLQLTPQGQRYYYELHRIFDDMVQATLALDPQSLEGRLTVGCSADTAANWLVPALGSFIQRYPEIQLQLLALQPGDEIDADIEVGIFNGLPATGTYQAEVLRQQHFYPVCAPGFISGASISLKPGDLSAYRLLHSDDGSCWNQWLTDAGVGLSPVQEQLFLPNVVTMLTAAKQGLGIALAQDLEVAEDLLSGSLIQLSDQGLRSSSQYYLLTLKDSLLSDRARVFSDWVRTLLR